jgi:hypothetical protein
MVVKKRQLPSYLVKKSPYSPLNLYYNTNTNCEEYFPKIGSFEIYFLNRLIFSKLMMKEWPNIDNLIIQIYKMALENKAFQSYSFGI